MAYLNEGMMLNFDQTGIGFDQEKVFMTAFNKFVNKRGFVSNVTQCAILKLIIIQ